MNSPELVAIFQLLHMTMAADKFHLEVAKAILDPKPMTEQRRSALLGQLAKRESQHEQIEQKLVEMKAFLEGGG